MEAKTIERFTPKLVVAVCDCVRSVADACMANGLISGDTCGDILESTVTSEDKTRKLLKAVRNCAEIDSISFDIFLRILNEKLPERSRAKLLKEMRAELTDEQARATPVNECTALVPSLSHEAMTSVYHGQVSVPHAHEPDISRLLYQEQNPFIGKLEESIREHERTIAEKKLLKEKLEENERLKAQLANMQSLLSLSNTSESQSTTTSMSDSDILQLKEKIEKLEQKSKGLGMEIRRYRCAIDIKGEKITQKLMIEQKKLELQYERRFQELKNSVMNYREFEREPHRYGSYYESDPEEGSVMNYRESKREPRPYYRSHYESDSREGSDYDVPISKRRKTESGNDVKADVVDDAVHYSSPVEQLNRPSLKDIIMEISTSVVEEYDIVEKWEDIGIQLDIADEALAAISQKHTVSSMDGHYHNKFKAFRDMIRVWVKQDNPPPTWSNFVEALERLNIFQQLANQLRSKYCLSPNSTKKISLDTKDSELAFHQPLLREIMLEYSLSSDKTEAEEHWDDIGIQIEIDDEKLESIRRYTEIDGKYTMAFRRMIRIWMKQKNPPPTWLSFVEALERLKICQNLSTHLRSKYCSSPNSKQELNQDEKASSIDQQLLLKEIMSECSLSSDKTEIEEHWDDIGIQIEIDDKTLEDIRDYEPRDEGAFRRMIRTWMKQKNPPPTWLSFVEALERLNICQNLSTHLRSKYCQMSECTENQEDLQNVGSPAIGQVPSTQDPPVEESWD